MRPTAGPSRGKVLVLGQDTRAFLSVIRSLGRRGLEVHAAWCDALAPPARSRYVRQHHELPPSSLHDDAWRDELVALLDREAFDLVVPCNDPSILPLQLHRKHFERFGRAVYLLDDVAFRVAFDKLESYDLARSVGVPVPRRMRVSSVHDLTSVPSLFAWPVVAKPRASFTADRLTSKHHVRWAGSPDELRRHVEALLPWGDVAVEERVAGRGAGVEVLAHEGEILVAFQHLRLHEPLAGGGSSYRCSVALHPGLLDASRAILKTIRYTGVAMIEFKVDLERNRWAFLEINGRFWGSLPLALAAGVDFPWYLYQMWVEGRREFPGGYRTGVRCRNLVNDLHWMTRALGADHAAPGERVSRRQVFVDLVPLLTLRDHSDTFVRDDPRPGFVELWQPACRVMQALARRGTRWLLSWPPWRRRRAARVRTALADARRVLFVCKGNICRSPFAHHLAAMVLPGNVRVESSGSSPEAGRSCPADAVAAAAELGVDLRAHRSRTLSAAMLRNADIVFVFDEDNYVTLRRRYGWVRSKVHFLGVVGSGASPIIRDPLGSAPGEFRAAYGAIRDSVMAVLSSLPHAPQPSGPGPVPPRPGAVPSSPATPGRR